MKRGPIFLICSLLVGVLIGVFLCNWTYFEFEKSIKFTDLIGILATSIIGLYIASVIGHKESSSRAEKDFFINEIKLSLSNIEKLRYYSSVNGFPFQETVALFKEMNMHLNMLQLLLNNSTSCKEIKIGKAIFKIMKSLRSDISSISPDPLSNVIKIKNTLSQKRIEAQLMSLKKEVTLFLLAVNK
jgi:hypothetical protein